MFHYSIETGTQTGSATAERVRAGTYVVHAQPDLDPEHREFIAIAHRTPDLASLGGWYVTNWEDGREVEWPGTHETLRSAAEAIIREAHNRAKPFAVGLMSPSEHNTGQTDEVLLRGEPTDLVVDEDFGPVVNPDGTPTEVTLSILTGVLGPEGRFVQPGPGHIDLGNGAYSADVHLDFDTGGSYEGATVAELHLGLRNHDPDVGDEVADVAAVGIELTREDIANIASKLIQFLQREQR